MFEIFGSECCYQQADAEQEGDGGGGEGGHGRGGVTLAGGAGVDAGPVLLDIGTLSRDTRYHLTTLSIYPHYFIHCNANFESNSTPDFVIRNIKVEITS